MVESISISHSVVSGYDIYYQVQDSHNLQFTQLSLSLLLGGSILYENYDDDIDWIGVSKDIVLFSAIRWIIMDGTYNLKNGNSFFHKNIKS